jgi:glycosyltransferase involved in cell wall biosynthesis
MQLLILKDLQTISIYKKIMILSILITTLDERAGLLCRLLDNLTKQIEENNAQYKVEILCELDNRVFTTGYKRNILLSKANGKYLVYIDDDDFVPSYYIKELLKAAESDADCFSINGVMITNSKDKMNFYTSINNKNITSSMHFYTNHISGIRSSIAKQFKFPDVTNGEDSAWMTAIHDAGVLKSEYCIEPELYFYNYNNKK